jgi:exopolysaccharide production protein ExoQ
MKNFLEHLMIFVYLLAGTGVGTIFYLGFNAPGTSEGGPIIYAIFGASYVFFLILVVWNYKSFVPVLLGNKWMALLWLWALASTAWSISPGVTLRRSVALLGTTIIGLFFATRFEPGQQIRIIANCMGLAGVASLIVCLFFPAYGLAPTGEWAGVFYQKNGLGRAMELGVLCYTFLALGGRRGRLVPVLMAVFCGGMLVMSQSAGAMIVCTAMLAFLLMRKILVQQARRLITFAGAALILIIPIAIYVIQNLDSILKTMGRDITLTGRIPLWRDVLDEIATNPWFGFGYSGFWYSWRGARIQAELNWQMIHAHDGFLEATLGLGLIGLAILSIVLVKSILRGIQVARKADSIEAYWPLFYLIFAILANLTENWFMTANSAFWMIFVASSYWLFRKSPEPLTEEEQASEPSPEFTAGESVGLPSEGSGSFA